MAIDVFMVFGRTISGVTLPAQDEVHDTNLDKEAGYVVELKSYYFGTKAPVTAGATGMSTGKLAADPLIITKQVDQLTPGIQAMLRTHAAVDVKIVVRRSGQPEPHLVYTLPKAVVCALTWATSNVDDVAEEHVSIAYSKLTVSYRPQDQAGTLLAPVTDTLDLMAVKL